MNTRVNPITSCMHVLYTYTHTHTIIRLYYHYFFVKRRIDTIYKRTRFSFDGSRGYDFKHFFFFHYLFIIVRVCVRVCTYVLVYFFGGNSSTTLPGDNHLNTITYTNLSRYTTICIYMFVCVCV